MSSVGEADAHLAQALRATEQAAAAVQAVSEMVDAALDLLMEAFDGVTQSQAEDAIGGLESASLLLTDMLSLLVQGDDSVRRYAAEVLEVDLSGGVASGGEITLPGGAAAGDGLTYPSRSPDPSALPRGKPARIGPLDNANTVRGRQRENEAAQVMAKMGYDIEQSPVVQGSKNPDYLIEGKIFDAYSPATGSVRNVWQRAESKVLEKQTSRVLLCLDDSDVTTEELRDQFDRWPIRGLREVLVLRDGEIARLVP